MIDLTAVIVAAIAGVPATVAAIMAVRNRRELRTRNGRTTGQTIDDTAQTTEIIQAQQHTNARDILGLHEGLGRIEEKVDRINGRVDRVDRKLDQHLTDVGEGSGKLADWVRKQMEEGDS